MKTLGDNFCGEESRANSIISATAPAKVYLAHGPSTVVVSRQAAIRLHIYKFHTAELSIAP